MRATVVVCIRESISGRHCWCRGVRGGGGLCAQRDGNAFDSGSVLRCDRKCVVEVSLVW